MAKSKAKSKDEKATTDEKEEVKEDETSIDEAKKEDKKEDDKVEDKTSEKDDTTKDGKIDTDDKDADDDGKKRKADDDKKEGEETEDRSKRRRKSAQTAVYQPENFKNTTHVVQIFRGRGKKLGDLIRDHIDKFKVTSDEMESAHKFLYSIRGKVPKNQIKSNILEFSGFLRHFDEDKVDKEAIDKEDEDAESKYSAKAYKLTVPHLKKLCDFFNVDRSSGGDGKSVGKDTLIDRLLDFLGAPSEELLKTKGPSAAKKASPVKASKKSSSPKTKPSKSKSKKKKGKDEDSDDDDDDDTIEEVEAEPEEVEVAATDVFAALKEHKKGEKPTDEVLRQWVQAYIVCFDMESSTAKHAVKTASAKFGVDLSGDKEKLKKILTEEM